MNQPVKFVLNWGQISKLIPSTKNAVGLIADLIKGKIEVKLWTTFLQEHRNIL